VTSCTSFLLLPSVQGSAPSRERRSACRCRPGRSACGAQRGIDGRSPRETASPAGERRVRGLRSETTPSRDRRRGVTRRGGSASSKASREIGGCGTQRADRTRALSIDASRVADRCGGEVRAVKGHAFVSGPIEPRISRCLERRATVVSNFETCVERALHGHCGRSRSLEVRDGSHATTFT
jgi:hypothetical protein